LLDSIKTQLLAEANTLYDEHWKSSAARDLFMKSGPGHTLAYLDEWLNATQANVRALRSLAGIATQSRTDMANLWAEYQQKIEEAKHVDGWTKFRTGALNTLTGGSDSDAMDQIEARAIQQVRDKQDEYDRKAQQLAAHVGNQYLDTFGTISQGN